MPVAAIAECGGHGRAHVTHGKANGVAGEAFAPVCREIAHLTGL
jgi:hypothetical protein